MDDPEFAALPCTDATYLVTGSVPKKSRDCYPIIERVQKYLDKLKGRVLESKTQRQEWVIRETIRQKLLVKYVRDAFYGPNRDGPCEWLGSKKDLARLDIMEELVYYTNKVQHPRTTTVLNDTSDSAQK